MNQILTVDPKDPQDTLPYGINWTKWLESQGQTISASEWTVPNGIVEESRAFTNHLAIIEVSGGTAGSSYSLTNRITTQPDGYVRSKTITIHVKEL